MTWFTHSKRLNIYSGVFLAICFGFFAYAHLLAFKKTHEFTLLLFCLSETLITVFLLLRTNPETVSAIRLDWLVGIVGTIISLLLRPAAWGIFPVAKHAITVGILLQIGGLVSLNRSFAFIAAKREIKTGGLYRFVRHPLYTSYIFTYSGYVLKNTTIANLLIYVVAIVLLFIRAFREEEHLAKDVKYRDYMQKVKYRIIPFVF